MEKHKLKGVLLTFVIIQSLYLFYFLFDFTNSFRNALAVHDSYLVAIASWLSMITMIAYCILGILTVVQLIMRKHTFLRWFQISGAIALAGNLIVFILRQLANSWSYENGSRASGDYYWELFVVALFWTLGWCLYFSRSSRVYSYMGENSTYLRMAFFTKNLKEPMPLMEFMPPPPSYVHPPQGAAPGYPRPTQGRVPPQGVAPPQGMGYGHPRPPQGGVPAQGTVPQGASPQWVPPQGSIHPNETKATYRQGQPSTIPPKPVTEQNAYPQKTVSPQGVPQVPHMNGHQQPMPNQRNSTGSDSDQKPEL